MAVLQPNAYAGIYEMLKQRAEQERAAPPSTLGVAAQAVGQAAGAYAGAKVKNKLDADQEKDLERFKNNLQKDLDANKVKLTAQAEGKSLRLQKDVDAYYESMGIPKEKAPRIPEEGIYLSDDDIQNKMKHAQFQTELQKNAEELSNSKDTEDQKRGQFLNMISLLPSDKMESVIDDIGRVMFPSAYATGSGVLIREVPGSGELGIFDRKTGNPIGAATGPAPVKPNTPLTMDNLTQVQKKLVRDEVEDLDKDPLVKAAKASASQIASIRKLIDKNLPQGVGILQSQLSGVVAGEKGVKTEGDIQRSTGDPSLVGSYRRFRDKILKGKMTAEDVKGFQELLNQVEDKYVSVIQETTTNRINRLKPEFSSFDEKQLEGLLRSRIELPVVTGGGYTSADEVKAAYKEGKIKKEQAIKILKEKFEYDKKR